MTDADLRAIADALEAERARWAERLLGLVDRTLDDAHAHAAKAITDTLRRAPDGRATVRRAARSPSIGAALDRLGGLLVRLTGPRRGSLAGLVRDAREDLYRLAFALHTPHIPASIRVAADPSPTKRNVDLVRGAALHGYDPQQELEKPFADAARQLAASVAMAASRDGDDRSGADVLAAWRTRAGHAISRSVLSLLSDSAEHASTEAMADLVHPDYRADGAADPED